MYSKVVCTVPGTGEKSSEESETWTWSDGPEKHLNINFAGRSMGKMFLVVVDAYSKFLVWYQ